ncbi:cupin domain-containing protein [Bremerella sp. JC817]|uniref:cupin domain-containing protein n=1 Tax=Bremerella sp. JC817 TaxID=3231756 RepID=UPI00345A5FD7
MSSGNLLASIPESLSEELFETLAQADDVKIERIVSASHASPEGFWYDQPQHEFVLLVEGEAVLRLEGEADPRHLKSGDFVNIPARQKHRVESTSTEGKTIWLAIHYGS